MGGLREYFNVTHAYVGKKLAFHLVPPAVALRTDGYEFHADSGVPPERACRNWADLHCLKPYTFDEIL